MRFERDSAMARSVTIVAIQNLSKSIIAILETLTLSMQRKVHALVVPRNMLETFE